APDRGVPLPVAPALPGTAPPQDPRGLPGTDPPVRLPGPGRGPPVPPAPPAPAGVLRHPAGAGPGRGDRAQPAPGPCAGLVPGRGMGPDRAIPRLWRPAPPGPPSRAG